MKKKISLLFIIAMFTMLLSVATFAAKPNKVEGLKQTEAGENYVGFEWNALLDSDIGYEVTISEDNISYVEITKYTTSTKCTKYSLNAGKSYYVRVRAVRNYYSSTKKEYGDYSTPIIVSTIPKDVNNIKQTGATTSSVTISWDYSSGATSYEVYKYTNSTFSYAGSTTSNTYTVTGFNNKIYNQTSLYVVPVRTVGGNSVKGKTDYSSSLRSYNIALVPAKITGVKIDSYYINLKQVSWAFDALANSDGYQYEIYTYKNKKVSSGYTTSYSYNSIRNVKSQFYKLRVRAYKKINNITYYGEWSDYTRFANQPKITLKKSGGNLKVSWKKVSGAKNYTIYMSTSKNSGYKKIATTSKKSYTVKKFKKKKLKKNKRYYVYVVANRKEGKKTYKSGVVNYFYLY